MMSQGGVIMKISDMSQNAENTLRREPSQSLSNRKTQASETAHTVANARVPGEPVIKTGKYSGSSAEAVIDKHNIKMLTYIASGVMPQNVHSANEGISLNVKV